MKKILISGYTGLGNFILKTPLIREIKNQFPDCQLDIIAGSPYGAEKVLGNSTYVKKILILKEGASFFSKLKFFFDLRAEGYDAIFLPFDSNRKFLFFGSYVGGVKERIVHVHLRSKLKTILFLLMPGTRVIPLLPGRHEVDLNFDLLENYLQKPFERNYQSFINTKDVENFREKFGLQSRYIVLQPGAANGAVSAKKWSPRNFKNLITKLNSHFPDLQIVTVGDKGDYSNDIKILEDGILKFTNVAGLTTIEEVSAIVKNALAVVANDSGIMHMANALGVDLIALYGPTDFTRTRPLGKKSRILYSKSKCFASMYNFTGNEILLAQQYPDSMDYISVDDVFDLLTGLVNG